MIRNSNADIVAVQELGPLPEENFGPLLVDQYPYQILRTDENYLGSGQGILSKFPLENERYWKAGSPWNGNLYAEVVFEGQRIAIYNLHPHPPIERGLQFRMTSHANVIREVIALASEETDPVLIVGDFNMMPEFPPYQWITEKYTDAYAWWESWGSASRILNRCPCGALTTSSMMITSVELTRMFYRGRWRQIICLFWHGCN